MLSNATLNMSLITRKMSYQWQKLLGRSQAALLKSSTPMLRSRKRLLLLLSTLVSLLIVTALLYMLGMTYLEGQPRGFWRAFEWAGEACLPPVTGRTPPGAIR